MCHLEERHTSFAVSRLIMMSGIPVRKFGADSEDSPEALGKIRVALRGILSQEALARMQHLFDD